MSAAVSASSLSAQSRYQSPIVHPDGTVTLQLLAPDAQEVLVKHIAPVGTVPLVKGDDGLWSVTVGPLKPEIYHYTFLIDGAELLDPKNRHIKEWIDSRSEFEIPGDPPLVHEMQDVPHGTIHHHFYPSKAVGKTRELFVYTPPGFDARADRKYPVLYLMRGFGDTASAWTANGRLHFIADNLIAAGKARPMIIVMPYGHPLPHTERYRGDDYGDRNRELYEADYFGDLIPFVETHYPIAEERKLHAIAGLSMGGGHALGIGLNHLDEFAWVGAFSAGVPVDEIDARLPALATDPASANDRIELLWIACGDHDFLLERNQQFVAWLDERGIEHTWLLTPDSGHDWKTWRHYARDFLPLLFEE